MLDAALAAGLSPDLVVGTSTGAINAALFAADPDTAVRRLVGVWNSIAADSSLTSTWRGAVRALTGNQSARTADMLREHLVGGLAEANSFADLAVPLRLVATDLAEGLPVTLSTGPLLDAVMASCAFPVLLPPADRGDRLLTDGSVTACVPVDQAVSAGAASVVLFDTAASAVTESAVTEIGWYSVIAMAFSHLVRGQAAHDLVEAGQRVPVVVISCDQGSPIDLKATPSLFDVGRDIARASLRGLPPIVREPGIYGVPIGLESDAGVARLLR